MSQNLIKVHLRLKPKMYNYFMDDGHIDNRAKGTKKCVIKREIKFRGLQKMPGEL